MELNCFVFADEKHIARERQKMRRAKKMRWWLDKKSRGICFYCQQQTAPKNLTMDHVVPLARGGTTTPGNIVAACAECNKKKSILTPVDLIFEKSDA